MTGSTMTNARALLNRLWPQRDVSTPIAGREGERGAIMVMGVFLAASMIAAMWYMMGIGDAILWRDHQQEAADSIAFTSAAIHARGMNFIAMINIIMLLIVIAYLILCILRTVLDLILYVTGDDTSLPCQPFFDLKYTKGHGAISSISYIAGFFATGDNVPRYGSPQCTGANWLTSLLQTISSVVENIGDNSAGRDLAIACASCPFWTCPVCFIPKCIASHPMHDIADKVGPFYNKVEWAIVKWEKFMRFMMPKFHTVEVATAVLTPWVGTGLSVYAGWQYKDGPSQEPTNKIAHKGIAISPSLFRKMKKPQTIKTLRADLQWIPCANQVGCGNGCGPTLCADGMVSRSGPRKTGTGGSTAECCAVGASGCTNAGTCNGHGQPAADQSGLYTTTTINDSTDYRIGLPVQAQNMNELCQKAFGFIGDGIKSMMDGVTNSMGASGTSTNGSWMKTNGSSGGGGGSASVSGLMDQLFNKAGSWFKLAYCTYDPTFSAAHSTTGDYEDVFPGENGHYDGSCAAVCSGSCPDKANDFWAINDTDECPFKSTFGHSIPLLFDGNHGGGNGPMKVVDYAPNGEDYNQIYGIVINDNYNPLKGEYGTANTQTAWSKIRLGVGPKEWGQSSSDDNSGIVTGDGALDTIASVLVGGNGNGPWFYIAEAEFYHDCESQWTDNDCNGGDHALYRLNWRTRLRRVRRPVYITELTNKIPNWVNKVAQFMSSNQWAINQFATNNFGIDLGTVFNYAELLTELGSSNPNGLMPPIYH